MQITYKTSFSLLFFLEFTCTLTYSRFLKINYTFGYIKVGASSLRYSKFFSLHIRQINIANKTDLQGNDFIVDHYPVRFCSSLPRNQFATTMVWHETPRRKSIMWFSPHLDDSPRAGNEFLDPQGASRCAHAPATAPALSSCRGMDFKVVINGNLLWTRR